MHALKLHLATERFRRLKFDAISLNFHRHRNNAITASTILSCRFVENQEPPMGKVKQNHELAEMQDKGCCAAGVHRRIKNLGQWRKLDKIKNLQKCRLKLRRFSRDDGDAIATGTEDRRAYVITFSGKTKEELLGKAGAEAYFDALYALLADPAFIQQFYFELATRDISGFNSHMRAPMTTGKIAMIESNKTEGQLLVDQLIAEWPGDIITNKDFTSILTEDGAVRHVDSRQIKYCWDGDKNPTVENLFRFGERCGRGRILRNADKWLNASGAERNAEVERAWRERSKGDKPLAATASELWTKHMS